jgi:glycosyltransferase involved in cell wall biosynthesis
MSGISIVVPVYHNAPSLPELMRQLDGLAARHPDDDFEFIFVDDGSTDDSYEVLIGLSGRDPRISVITLSRNFGSNSAILAGMSRAKGDAIGVLSADLQDPPEVLDEMMARWRSGRKVVLAVRTGRADPWLTRKLASAFYALFRRFALASMPPGGFDFYVIDRQVCELINGIQESNAYLVGLVLWLGFDPAVVSYDRRARERRYGRSMWTWTRKIKYFVDSFVAFSYVPLRLASGLGIALSVLGLLYAVVVLVGRAFARAQPPGYASLMVVVLVASGVQLFMIGILGEYVWRNLEETRRRPRFIIERVVAGRDRGSEEQQGRGRGRRKAQDQRSGQ